MGGEGRRGEGLSGGRSGGCTSTTKQSCILINALHKHQGMIHTCRSSLRGRNAECDYNRLAASLELNAQCAGMEEHLHLTP